MTQDHYAGPGDAPGFVAYHDTRWTAEEIVERIGALHARTKNLLANIAKRPHNLSSLSASAFELAAYTHLARPDAPILWSLLRLSARAGAADALRQSPGTEPVAVNLGAGIVHLPRREPYGDRGGIEAGGVCRVYYAALAARDGEALSMLARCDMSRLMYSPPQLVQRTVTYPFCLGLQTLMRAAPGDADAGTKLLVDAMTACNDSRIDRYMSDDLIFTVSPSIELALRHRHADETSASRGWPPFAEVLRQALTYHRHYWRDVISQDGVTQGQMPESFIALGPLAFAALRHDAGLPVPIASDYLPASIVEGRVPAEIAGGGIALGDLVAPAPSPVARFVLTDANGRAHVDPDRDWLQRQIMAVSEETWVGTTGYATLVRTRDGATAATLILVGRPGLGFIVQHASNNGEPPRTLSAPGGTGRRITVTIGGQAKEVTDHDFVPAEVAWMAAAHFLGSGGRIPEAGGG